MLFLVHLHSYRATMYTQIHPWPRTVLYSLFVRQHFVVCHHAFFTQKVTAYKTLKLSSQMFLNSVSNQHWIIRLSFSTESVLHYDVLLMTLHVQWRADGTLTLCLWCRLRFLLYFSSRTVGGGDNQNILFTQESAISHVVFKLLRQPAAIMFKFWRSAIFYKIWERKNYL
jgi:hypothetical protein